MTSGNVIQLTTCTHDEFLHVVKWCWVVKASIHLEYMKKLSKSSYWIPFFRHSNGKNSCWKTERVQGEKGCWSGTQGKVPQEWAREVEKRCWDREKEENWWPVWEGSEMEAQAVEGGQRTTEEEVFQNNCLPSRQCRTQSDGAAATLKRMTDRLIRQGQDVPGAWTPLSRPA